MTRALEMTGDLIEIDLSLHAVYNNFDIILAPFPSISLSSTPRCTCYVV